MSEIKLKPCPHCGSEAKMKCFEDFFDDDDKMEYRYYVMCTECFALSDFFPTEEWAAWSWNRRVQA